MISVKNKTDEKYMFESIYDYIVDCRITNFHKDIERIVEDSGKKSLCHVNIENIRNTFKEYLKKRVKDISQAILIVDINEEREEIFGNECMDGFCQYLQYLDQFFEEFHYEEFIVKYKCWYDKLCKVLENEYSYLLKIVGDFLNDIEMLVEQGIIKKADYYFLHEIKSVGDKHNGSKSVVRCLINDEYLIYKPESGRIYELYSKVIKIVSDDEKFRVLNILQRDSYFWCEYVKNESCFSKNEIKEFYKNAGLILVTAYFLNSVDIHNENVIAVGKYPVIIDAETVTSMECLSEGVTEGRKILEKSIFITSIIPMYYDKRGEGVRDCSALGDIAVAEKTEYEVIDEFTSSARLVRVKKRYEDINTHLPKIGEKAFPVWEYISDIISGFEKGYENAVNRKSDLKKLLLSYEDVKVRIVLRSTSVYSELLRRLNVPDLLKDKNRAAEFLEHFLKRNSFDDSCRKSEIRQLLLGDVPYFNALLKNKDICAEGQRLTHDNYYLSSLDGIMQKLENTSEFDKKRQIDYIKIAFNYKNRCMAFFKGNTFEKLDKEVQQYRNELKLHINDHLFLFSFQKNWKGQYSYDEVNSGIYEGYLGIVPYDGEEKKLIKREVIHRALGKIKKNQRWGIIDGFAGAILFLKMDTFFSEDDKNEMLYEILSEMEKCIQVVVTENRVDIIEGVSGAIIALGHYAVENSEYRERVTELIEKLANSIVALWKTKKEALLNVKGFAHGITGIKVAMYLAWQIFKYAEYIEIFWEMEKYDEKTVYQTNNWCNGMVGYYISYYLIYKFADMYPSNNANKDKAYAWKKLEECGDYIIGNAMNMDDFCLCHGFLGAFDFLMTLDGEGVLSDKQKMSYKNGLRKAVDRLNREAVCALDISLFTGITGISYIYKRQEKKIASILTYLY